MKKVSGRGTPLAAMPMIYSCLYEEFAMLVICGCGRIYTEKRIAGRHIEDESVPNLDHRVYSVNQRIQWASQ